MIAGVDDQYSLTLADCGTSDNLHNGFADAFELNCAHAGPRTGKLRCGLLGTTNRFHEQRLGNSCGIWQPKKKTVSSHKSHLTLSHIGEQCLELYLDVRVWRLVDSRLFHNVRHNIRKSFNDRFCPWPRSFDELYRAKQSAASKTRGVRRTSKDSRWTTCCKHNVRVVASVGHRDEA